MRLVVLDLELTGLDPEGGGRIASLGLVEVFDNARMGTGKEWFFHPEGQPIEIEGQKIHGLTEEFLKAYPPFSQQIDEISAFIADGKIAHHCWLYRGGPLSVDEKFMEMEFGRAGQLAIGHDRWINMKELAKKIDPEKNSLNNMLDRYGIDRSSRDKYHGALIDASLTAGLYIKYRSLGFEI